MATNRLENVRQESRRRVPGRIVEQALFGAIQIVFMGLMILFSAAIFFDGTTSRTLEGGDVAVREAQQAKQVVSAPRPIGEPRALGDAAYFFAERIRR